MEKEFYLKRWPVVRQDTLAILETFSDEDLEFIPVRGGWTVATIMCHIAETANFWLHGGAFEALGVKTSKSRVPEKCRTLEEVLAYLADEHQRTMQLLADINPADWQMEIRYADDFAPPASWVFWHVLEHEIHHRGELSLITGILGREGLDL
ncbi:MAG: DinB family protein [Anaerolineaceae bacterium]|nr:DinB family protein [Anaerolineaceae bacterium]